MAQAQAYAVPDMAGVTAERLGPFKLRGVMDKVELLHCRWGGKGGRAGTGATCC